MISASAPENEKERLDQLLELNILDTLEEQQYDDLTYIASQICNTPIALVSLIDKDRQWFKSHYGLDARETPRDVAFCSHAILSDDVFIIEDAEKDERFADNPLQTDAPYVKFYAGAPLIFDKNIRLGTLCVIDNKPKKLDADQIKALQALARQVVSQLRLRLNIKSLEHLDHVKDEFLSMVSHELRTPLTSIKGSLSILNNQSGNLDKESTAMLDIACRNTNQLLVIVNDILDLAKMEAGKFEITKKEINLKSLLLESHALNMSYAQQFNCNIKLELPENNDTRVSGDEKRLQQVITNLISNAVKFSNEDSQIELSLTTEKNLARISVTDHGCGIADSQHDLIFKKFKQLEKNGNNKLPGTGLGLNICKHIIELHKGNIDFESTPGKGTSFYFTIPLI